MSKNTNFADLWDRFREVCESVSDVKALFDLVSSRAEQAHENVESFLRRKGESHDEDYRELLEAKAAEWKKKRAVEREKQRVLRAMMNYLVSSDAPSVPVPAFGDLTESDQEAMRTTYDAAAVPRKQKQVIRAIRRVLASGQEFNTKTEFYAAVDQERGLSGEGRATERWVRDNERNPVPPPDYWRKKLTPNFSVTWKSVTTEQAEGADI
jgi:hypothetical protein